MPFACAAVKIQNPLSLSAIIISITHWLGFSVEAKNQRETNQNHRSNGKFCIFFCSFLPWLCLGLQLLRSILHIGKPFPWLRTMYMQDRKCILCNFTHIIFEGLETESIQNLPLRTMRLEVQAHRRAKELYKNCPG